ncbi:MAG: HpcH/HpaI aldolase family protein [Alphaproteobacteria bacterium]
MKIDNPKNEFKNGKVFINGWLSIPNAFTAEAMAKIGWDSLTIDMQHGQSDYSSSISMLQALKGTNTVPFVRVPWNEPGIIMRMLDLGVIGVVAPMINTKKQCEEFVSYCYYPPMGQRSYGPMRAQLNYGSDYYEKANNIISLAMIETREAVENLDEILSVPDLSGVYIGPADMCSSYGLKPQFDPRDDKMYSNIKLIVKKAREKNKIAGIHTGSTEYAKEMIQLGFQFVTILSEFRFMTAYAENIINEMKNEQKESSSGSTY